MEPVTISPKFQVVIPKHIRESLKLAPGQKVQAIVYENRNKWGQARFLHYLRAHDCENR